MPNQFFWDASALVKRYAPESGTHLVNFLFSRVNLEQMICLSLGVSEVLSVFVRKKNDGVITEAIFSQALAELRAELLNSSFKLAPLEDRLVFASQPLIINHSLNATDALVLRAALELRTALRRVGDDLVLIASDQRLLRAAEAEALQVFNPETDSQARLEALI